MDYFQSNTSTTNTNTNTNNSPPMDSCYSLTNLPVPQLEPVQHLGPYLTCLDFDRDLEKFGRLADQVSETDDTSVVDSPLNPLDQVAWSPLSSFSSVSCTPDCACQPALSPPPQQAKTHSQLARNQLASSWPSHHQQVGGAPNLLPTCAINDVAAANQWDRQQLYSLPSCNSSCLCSSSWVSSAASSPMPSPSVATATSYKSYNRKIDGGTKKRRARSSRSSTVSLDDDYEEYDEYDPFESYKRIKNADAAERYRKKLKGRKLTLFLQMQREYDKNEQLRQSVESNLALYREFVSLLARNTGQRDAELAQIGHKSLTNVLSLVNQQQQIPPTNSGATNQSATNCDELLSHLEHFRQVLTLSPQTLVHQTQTTSPVPFVSMFGAQTNQRL